MGDKKWRPIPIEAKWFANVHETALTRGQAALENAFINEAGGQTRFPGLEAWATLNDNGRVYLFDWQNDLVAATSNGQFYRIDRNANVEQITGPAISGGNRVIFSKADTELHMAAGGPIMKFAGDEITKLSDDAPEATHVQFIDSYVVANEKDSGRFQHAAAGVYDQWDPIDTFAANGQPDKISFMLVTPFRELIVGGPESVEQFERLNSGDTPFFRRWAVGEGIAHPYTVVATDNGVWGINEVLEFVRLSGQTSEPRSNDVGRQLEAIDDWTDAWVGGFPDTPLNILGQKFVLLQAPKATNPYGTKGLTFLYDYRQDRWTTLYGWDEDLGLPTRWPGWSYWHLNGTYYVGGEGKVYKLSNTVFQNDSIVQRMYCRTAPLHNLGEIRIDNLRVRVRRGTGTYSTQSQIALRVLRDGGRRRTKWIKRGLGKSGEREMVIEFGGLGCGHDWQFEIMVTDDTPIELVKMEAQTTPLGE